MIVDKDTYKFQLGGKKMHKKVMAIGISLVFCSLMVILCMQFLANEKNLLPQDFKEFITCEEPMPLNASDEEISKWIETTKEYLENYSGQKVVNVTEDDEKITFYFENTPANSKWKMESTMYFK